uniref:Chaperonin GroEL, chloroplastic n=1 Tax=Polysiphonia infestans TaxID=2006978 RepID=A0A1Z1MEF6_9FLOR|nr:60-kDa chaperonin [Polysiphonia infestans]ARW64458.1 60-kDa chaperonin [Polysiphonia infestans]
MNKTILYHDDARKALEKGMDILSEAVSITLGPKGRNVVLEKKYGSPQIINDGVTIAKEIELPDSIENTGVALIRQAASKTNDVAGDGTTTATVLAYAMVKEGLKNVAAGSNPIILKKGMIKAVKFVTKKISQCSRPINSSRDISQVASISAGNDKYIGKIISEAIQKVGKEGIISIEEGQSTETFLDIKEGMKFDKGFISPYFITDTARMEVVQENSYVLVTDKKITLIQEELLPVLEQVSKTGMSLMIIAEDIEKEALATIVVNKLRGIINVAAVRAPGFGDRRKFLLEDIAILTSGDLISDETGLTLNKISLPNLGFAKKILISKDNTTIIADSNQTAVNDRCDEIRKQISISTNSYEREKLQERLAKLSSGVAIIKVGAATEIEMKNKKLRLEDAINATKAAVEEGIVPGGGSTYIHLSKELLFWSEKNLIEEELVGALIVQKALSLPLSRIATNAGLNGAVTVEKVNQSTFPTGYDINYGVLVDMYDAGIIDPAKVTRSALQNAASIASMILTTECIIVDAS